MQPTEPAPSASNATNPSSESAASLSLFFVRLFVPLSLLGLLTWHQQNFFKKLIGIGQTYTITFPTPPDVYGRTMTVELSAWHATRNVHDSTRETCDNDGHVVTCQAFLDLDDDVFASVALRYSGDSRPNWYYGPFHVSIRDKDHTYEAEILQKQLFDYQLIAPYHRGHGTPPIKKQTDREKPAIVSRTYTVTFPTPKASNGRTVMMSLSARHDTRDISRASGEGPCVNNGPQISCKATLNLPPDASAEVRIRFSGDRYPMFYFGAFHASVQDGSQTYEVDIPDTEDRFDGPRIPPPAQPEQKPL